MGGPGSGPPEPPLTAAQRFYLDAFDQFLGAETLAEQFRARASMAVRLNMVLDEADVSRTAPPEGDAAQGRSDRPHQSV